MCFGNETSVEEKQVTLTYAVKVGKRGSRKFSLLELEKGLRTPKKVSFESVTELFGAIRKANKDKSITF